MHHLFMSLYKALTTPDISHEVVDIVPVVNFISSDLRRMLVVSINRYLCYIVPWTSLLDYPYDHTTPHNNPLHVVSLGPYNGLTKVFRYTNNSLIMPLYYFWKSFFVHLPSLKNNIWLHFFRHQWQLTSAGIGISHYQLSQYWLFLVLHFKLCVFVVKSQWD